MYRFTSLLLLAILLSTITSCALTGNTRIRGYKISSKINDNDSKKYLSNNKSNKIRNNYYEVISSEDELETAYSESSLIASLDENLSSILISGKNKQYQTATISEKTKECDNI